MAIIRNILVYVWVLSVISCGGPELPELVSLEYDRLPKDIDFNLHVKPILSDKCFICHGPDKAKIKADLQLHTPEAAYRELKESPGKFALTPGSLRKSEVFHRILSDDPNYVMPEPDSHLSLSDHEKAVLIKWIEQGAEYKDHWAFIKPKKYPVPEVKGRDMVENAIDNFVLARLEQDKLQFSPKADNELLLRRLYLDLTGLPPTLQDMDSFLEDPSSEAYEKEVDKLLDSPHYGEQMALDWMDLARFADTHGYSVDRYRDMSPWRDWVIDAFNKNMSYEQFLTWQLAGDLIENPTRESILATAFNRVHPQNMEGGIVNEEFLVEYAVDRASTVGQAFMGLTVACARCHDHKYDPISHKNFYELTSFFNNVNESGQISWNDATPVPTLMLTTEEEEKVLSYMKQLIQETEVEIKKVEQREVAVNFDKWLSEKQYKSIGAKVASRGLTAYFDLNDQSLRNVIDPYQKGTMKREGTEGQKINLSSGKQGKGVLFDGDTWLDLRKTGVFGRNDAFSISLWANIPSNIENGNIFHKGDGAILYNWRGYHLKIVDNKLELMMAHTAPNNAIVEIAAEPFPRDQWVHFAITYDGSSKADGYKLFVNGKEMETLVKTDNLYKDILFRNNNEPGLQLGARLRGKGIKGAVVDEIKVYKRDLSSLEVMQLAGSPQLNELIKKEAGSIGSRDKKLLQEHYLKVVSVATQLQGRKLDELRKNYVDSVEKVKEVMVMEETPEPVPSYILDRGVYNARGEEVVPNTPEAILPMQEGYPKNRLGFAQWLFHEDHPLTARVAVNRFWQHYFGNGLVKTSEDFGNQGEMPSHPELLDWLALEFRDSGWDVKAIQKLIVMSHTYRQSSMVSGELMEMDMDNRLLARGPSKRLSGEMLRDNALASSGLLNKSIGGESVSPYQPEGLWRVNNATYRQDTGDKLYRRSMYTIWKRSVPHPTLATFDAPARDVCTIRRQETNTPLQALVLLNDPTYIEASRVLGKHISDAENLKLGVSKVFRQLTGRKIKDNELQLLVELQEKECKKFATNLERTKGWLNTGEFKLGDGDDKAMVAANAVVANTIMNGDACITKR
ncbi:DUF1553 domain-containing protein [Arenibacter sp. M-2]|uniref:DUF1553 domain-containing protein n=1 Tax=Arenibacter sp. M-2 TaxID=3053612 RepID=UPI002570843B|nr:DUF1553 domain-containing protein [Arenibacter sp. M-2]MDL5514164.1 DUF1553 domain-containing protein [Arenibacter sp. M-2]